MLKYSYICAISLLSITTAFASNMPSTNDKNSVDKDKCKTLICVRNKIDEVNNEIIKLLAKRTDLVLQAGEIKLKNNIKSAIDEKRAEEVINKSEEIGRKEGLPPEFTKNVFKTIVTESAKYEQEHMNKK